MCVPARARCCVCVALARKTATTRRTGRFLGTFGGALHAWCHRPSVYGALGVQEQIGTTARPRRRAHMRCNAACDFCGKIVCACIFLAFGGGFGGLIGFFATGNSAQRIKQLEELPALLGADLGLTVFLHVPYAQRIPKVLPWLECHARPSKIVMFVKPSQLHVCEQHCSKRRSIYQSKRCVCGLHSQSSINQKKNLSSFFMHHALEYLDLKSTALLFAHADFYLDVKRFIGNGRAITVAEPENMTEAMGVGTSRFNPVPGTNGTRDMIHHRGLGCINLDALDEPRYEWHRGYRRTCRSAAGAIGSAVCCVAWTDAFYLPARPARAFVNALPLVHHLPNEAALPTLLNHVAQIHMNGFTRVVRCPGGCCSSVPWKEALLKGCGHRVNLASVPLNWNEFSCLSRFGQPHGRTR